jgi:hypothetical protein
MHQQSKMAEALEGIDEPPCLDAGTLFVDHLAPDRKLAISVHEPATHSFCSTPDVPINQRASASSKMSSMNANDVNYVSPTKVHRGIDSSSSKRCKEDIDGAMSPESLCRQHRNAADLEYCDDLVVATAIYDESPDESDDGYLPTCVEFDPDSKPASNLTSFYRRIAIAICIAIALIVGAIAFTIKRTSKTGNEMEWIREEIEATIGSPLETLDEPYRKALDWMMYNDPIRHDVGSSTSNLFQRYILTYLYFATSIDGEWGSCAPPKINDDSTCSYVYDDDVANRDGQRWLSYSNECEWAGISCNADAQIESIRMCTYFNNSRVPSFCFHFSTWLTIAILSSIGILCTDSFKLSGTFPGGVLHLTALKVLILSDSNLRGPLPTDIMHRLINLQSFSVETNQFTGSIPQQWFVDTPNKDTGRKLKSLKLGNNFLTGVVPSELPMFESLRELIFSNNQLQGTIPANIGVMKDLTLLAVNGNNLHGSIPSEIANFSNSLVDLTIASNNFTGLVPESLYELSTLIRLDISNNQFNGTLRRKIAIKWPNMKSLDIGNNQLSGTIPSQMKSMTHMKEFFFADNRFTGTIPDGLCQFASARCCQVCCTVNLDECPTNGTNIDP